jgi:hypothetical protein
LSLTAEYGRAICLAKSESGIVPSKLSSCSVQGRYFGLGAGGMPSLRRRFPRLLSRLLVPRFYTPDKLTEQLFLKISFQSASRWSGRSSIISKPASKGASKSRINRTNRSPPASLSVARMTRRANGSFSAAWRILIARRRLSLLMLTIVEVNADGGNWLRG